MSTTSSPLRCAYSISGGNGIPPTMSCMAPVTWTAALGRLALLPAGAATPAVVETAGVAAVGLVLALRV
jgi:hypothetical protein